ncbi:MAG: hypothetical protein U5L72_14740 [Bacteroidales bacterium]|nr:hypothetical protein [Bacteroidales bacterium]
MNQSGSKESGLYLPEQQILARSCTLDCAADLEFFIPASGGGNKGGKQEKDIFPLRQPDIT